MKTALEFKNRDWFLLNQLKSWKSWF